MAETVVLASGSEIRRQLLEQAGVSLKIRPARIDEEQIKSALVAEGAPARDIADVLAEAKARKVSNSVPDSFVLGCDQVLEFNGELISKPAHPKELLEQLQKLRGQTHRLVSAVVIYHHAQPIWRKIAVAELTMRSFSDSFADKYVAEHWEAVRQCVGGYQIEAGGARLFTRISGDYFSILGLPLLEVLDFLTLRGVLEQ